MAGLEISPEFNAIPGPLRRVFVRGYRAGRIPGVFRARKLKVVGGTPSRRALLIAWVGLYLAKQKVISLWSDDGQPRPSRVIKIPLDGIAKERILHEAAMLRELEKIEPTFAPRLLELDSAGGISHQSVVACGERVTRLDEAVLSRLKSIWGETSSRTRSFAETDFALKFPKYMSEAPHCTAEERALLDKAMETLDRRWNSARVTTLVHGDLHPGSLFREGGVVRAIDWETAARDTVPLFDVFRFWFNRCWWSVRSGFRNGLAQAIALSKRLEWAADPELQGLAWSVECFVKSLRSRPGSGLSELFIRRNRHCLEALLDLA